MLRRDHFSLDALCRAGNVIFGLVWVAIAVRDASSDRVVAACAAAMAVLFLGLGSAATIRMWRRAHGADRHARTPEAIADLLDADDLAVMTYERERDAH